MAEEDESRRQGREGERAGQAHGEYDVGRLLALSDGVFAIAMTLLVLDIPVPSRITANSDAALQAALRSLYAPVLAFVLSFLLVGLTWLRHRSMLRGLARTDGGLAWINLLMLLLVCLVPFTAAVLSRHGDLATAVVLYAANMALVGVAGLGLRWRCWHGGLLRTPLTTAERRTAMLDSLLSIGVFGVSMPIALFSPTAAEAVWFASGFLSFRRGAHRH